MRLRTRPRRTRPTAWPLQCRAVGPALLVHPKGPPDRQAVEFTAGLAPDPQHTPVVLDLPHGAPHSVWDAVARLLAGRPGSLRLVFGRATPAEARWAGQRIADRLRRVVLVPDGRPVPTAGGGLFVPIDHGAGWLQLRPDAPARPESRRYPRPMWEFTTLDRPWATSPYGVVESVPCGVWLRGARPNALHDGWRRLVESLPTDPQVLTVVLGSPGGPAVPLADAFGLWNTVLPSARRQVRFVPYGPVALPSGAGALGQELADAFGEHVVVCAGLPVLPAGHDAPPDVRGLLPDGSPGWQPFAAQYRYSPRRHPLAETAPPELLGVRSPLPGLAHVGAGVFELAPDTVLEIVQSGLWVRPALEPYGGNDIRRRPAPWGHAALLYDRSEPARAERMHAFAQDLLWRLPPDARDAFRIAPADAPGLAAPAEQAGPWSLGEPVAMDDNTRPGTAPRSAPRRPAHLAFWATADSATAAGSGPVVAGTAGAGAAGAPARLISLGGPRTRRRAGVRPAGGTVEDLAVTGAADTRAAAPAARVPVPDAAPALPSVHSAPAGSGHPSAPARPSGALLSSAGPASGAPGTPATPGTALPQTTSAPVSVPGGPPGAAGGAQVAVAGGPTPAQVAADPFDTRMVRSTGAGLEAGPYPAEGRVPGAPTRDEPPTPAAPGGPAPVPEPVLAPPAPPAGPPTPAADGPAAPPTEDPAAPPVPARPDAPVPGEDLPRPPAPSGTSEPSEAPATPAPPAARPARLPGIRLESLAPPEPVPAAPRAVPDRSPAPAVVPVPALAAASAVRVQPVPAADASAVPHERGMAREREWVWRTFARQFNAASGTVSRVLSESPGLRGATRAEETDAFTDLAALRLYLTGDGAALDAAVRTATVGPHVPLARCVAAGLRRLPSHRGATLLRAALHPSERAWYRQGDVLTEWAFCTAWARTAEPVTGATDFLIWSLTARRTALLAPAAPDRVVFPPGTRFRVLGSDDQDRLLLRELSASEGSENRKTNVPLDEIALDGLARAADGPASPARTGGDAGPTPPVPGTAPGLLPRTAPKAVAA
ncbi:hypothetical protein AB0D08_35305 [Kitasatospora sp. NPDC048540]|uniref:hypothetical protein n=1 Tax=Kitasatospora sp. NPDC048540 TaxID=3155634 RepID=UPI00341147BC